MANYSIIKKMTLMLVSSFFVPSAQAGEVVWYDGQRAVAYSVQRDTDPVVSMALGMFADDMQAVTGRRAVKASESTAVIHVFELDKASSAMVRRLKKYGVDTDSLRQKTDGFSLSVADGKIIIAGTNGRGTAYGILELSRMAGVSPWIWWGDVVPERKNRLTIDSRFSTLQGASVEYRGVFLNDEDWSTRPWSALTHAPSAFGTISSQTYKRIFRLLMRLRANAVWPAMHEGTTAFFRTEGAKAVADSCGIAIGSSHCEPLLRCNPNEWYDGKRGRFNYITNRKEVQDYWADRLREVKGSKGGNLFTIGMRGIHDGSMEGVKTMQEKQDALQQVIDDQQELLRRHIGRPERQTQVFIPYKEVLQIYEKGLRVPDYVTLMWCDDNYGYLTRLSDAHEQKRGGGAGVYYHLSYWGRPHDHLWLSTTQPGLIYNEMRQAYDHNVRKMWIVNVHDIKVSGYALELFMDMAWNIGSVSHGTLTDHYSAWLCREFGRKAGLKLLPAMQEYYRLCGQRKPEFMGWSQVELSKQQYARGLSPATDTEFSLKEFGGELDRYLDRYASVARTVEQAAKDVRPELADAYFAAIRYPVLAASAHARKLLEAQRSRSYANGSYGADRQKRDSLMRLSAARSLSAYRQIADLTHYYNNTMAGGKWRHLMCDRPRDLPVFRSPDLPVPLSDSETADILKADTIAVQHPVDTDGTIARNASDFQTASSGTRTIQMLGHSMNAVPMERGGELTYTFTTDREGEALLRIALIPTQPNDDGDLRFSVSIDGAEPTVFSLKEPFRSEQWKKNVLRGQALKQMKVNLNKGRHTLRIKALDNHVVADQWMIDFKPSRRFYLFPVE